MFFNFGSDPGQLANEVTSDLYNAIITSLGTTNFNRGAGIGVDSLENVPTTIIDRVFLGIQIALAIAAYNKNATSDRQVVTSQELITVTNTKDGASIWVIYFYLVSQTGTTGTLPNSVTLGG